MLSPADITDPGIYWYLDAIGASPQVVEVVAEPGEDLIVRFTGRDDEELVADLWGTFVGPLRPPGAHRDLNDAERKAVKAELLKVKTGPKTQKDDDFGHPSA